MTESPYLRAPAAAQWLHIHPQTLRRYVREGKLAVYKLGKVALYKVSDLEALVGAPKPPNPMTLKVQRQIASAQAAQEAHEARMRQLRADPRVIRG